MWLQSKTKLIKRQNEDKGRGKTKLKRNTKTRQRQNKYTDKSLFVTLKPAISSTIKDSAVVTVKDKEKQRHGQGQYQRNTKTKQKQGQTQNIHNDKYSIFSASSLFLGRMRYWCALLAPKVLLEYLWPMITNNYPIQSYPQIALRTTSHDWLIWVDLQTENFERLNLTSAAPWTWWAF